MALHPFSRSELLIGTEGLEKLKQSNIAVFGIGGVGTFAVEALARTGVGKFVLVDDDDICLTNINRQLHATRSTVGKSKVGMMKERILDINPKAEVTVFKELYNSESAERLLSQQYDYAIDAIDMVTAKLDLIVRCKEKDIPIISSMGAGNKLDPTKFVVDDIYNTSICPLAKAVRKELRKRGVESLKVVYSQEKPMEPQQIDSDCKTDCICPNKDRTCTVRHQIPGSVAFVPSVVGLIIASVVVRDLINWEYNQ
ncbi:tRNA threonylcarbamoyladenosine dehydratase [Clostridium formicaceticum]|uniref:tRNA cyclic N6-threonylcarbamoyladenosine(37) synthase TcdA n=1 Tax=Clostridium formicaceticum TaxID=1497 RepID=A0AAC9RI34_9CLOT|nr:tRNA threonylcarbamoyladenosine dehydratase [Clostridium formicaceticum]AOY76955.1 tRNA cyclic N6-threonylcarbamoyladenosine(37) synthase TcdA [Clostridium formicaceticum]ARE87439.1 tRNA threonylcarbamoyladenosine dehydratase [Clostridium formicaceticum]